MEVLHNRPHHRGLLCDSLGNVRKLPVQLVNSVQRWSLFDMLLKLSRVVYNWSRQRSESSSPVEGGLSSCFFLAWILDLIESPELLVDLRQVKCPWEQVRDFTLNRMSIYIRATYLRYKAFLTKLLLPPRHPLGVLLWADLHTCIKSVFVACLGCHVGLLVTWLHIHAEQRSHAP